MDMAKYEEKRFNEVKEEVLKQLKLVGYKTEDITFVAGASFPGDNVAKKTEHREKKGNSREKRKRYTRGF